MKTIVLGREGTQPFKIKNEDVSRQHAQITIDDHGEWVLEDLNSSNGTFIRNENSSCGTSKHHPYDFYLFRPR